MNEFRVPFNLYVHLFRFSSISWIFIISWVFCHFAACTKMLNRLKNIRMYITIFCFKSLTSNVWPCIMTHLIYACSSYANILCYLLNLMLQLWHSDTAVGRADNLLHMLSPVHCYNM